MKKIIILFLLMSVLFGAIANDVIFDAAEELRVAGDRQEAFDMLEDGLKSAGSNSVKSEYYWRMAETYINMGDDAEGSISTDELLKIFEQGEAYADMSIAADTRNHMGYYMKSANVGRWGQTKGIISSLFKTGDMKDALIKAITQKSNFSGAWNVLGMLYAAVPGRPISFGNMSFAVSLNRKALNSRLDEIRLGEEDDLGVGIRKELALSLWDRDWNSSKRRREQGKMKREFDKESDLFEKNCYYEGTVSIPNMNDQDEAIQVMEELIDFLEDKSNPTVDDRNDLAECREILADWN